MRAFMTFSIENLTSLNPSWGWLLSLGILFIILGLVGLGMTAGLTIVSIIFFGILLIIGGFSHIIYVFRYKDLRGIVWQAFIAIFYILAGCAIIYDPILSSLFITAFLGGIFVIIGITRIVLACAAQASATSSRAWLFVAGLCGLFLGIIILAQWPLSGLWFIGLFIAIEMIMTGWSYIILALSFKNAAHR
jgi:uncharacterized membrane protein HdeD (DUF308 family)